MKAIEPSLVKDNFIEIIGKEWMLVSAGDKDKFNMMTASWGGVGFLWNKPHFLRFLRRGYEERIVSVIRFVIVLDKVSYIDLLFPGFSFELRPVLVFKLHKLILSISV